MEPSEGFTAFVAAYEAGSITGGAERLGLPRATLSRQLSRLEDRLGVRLVHRDTHRFDPTQAGEELYRRARRIVADSREALDAIRREDGVPRGLLRVSVPPPDREAVFARMLAAFACRWPEVRLEVHAGSAHVDLRAERFDVAVRAGPIRDPDLVARVLARTCAQVVASPDYLARRGTPKSLAQLADHELLLGFEAGTLPARRWPLLDGGHVPVEGRLATNDLRLLHLEVLAGHGLALLPHLLVGEELAEGRLVPVLPDAIGVRSQLAVVYPERAYMLPKVRAFVDHIVEWAAEERLGERAMP